MSGLQSLLFQHLLWIIIVRWCHFVYSIHFLIIAQISELNNVAAYSCIEWGEKNLLSKRIVL
jgi:hypothetical protein